MLLSRNFLIVAETVPTHIMICLGCIYICPGGNGNNFLSCHTLWFCYSFYLEWPPVSLLFYLFWFFSVVEFSFFLQDSTQTPHLVWSESPSSMLAWCSGHTSISTAKPLSYNLLFVFLYLILIVILLMIGTPFSGISTCLTFRYIFAEWLGLLSGGECILGW